MAKADYETAIDALKCHRGLSGLRARAKPAGVLPDICGAYGMDRSRPGPLPGREHATTAIALDERDPWGHVALGYWALMEWRTVVDRVISPGGRSQSEFRRRPQASRPWPRVRRTGSRGDRSFGRGDLAQSARSDDGAVVRAMAVALPPGATPRRCGSRPRPHDGQVFRVPIACAVRALRWQVRSRTPELIL